MHRRGRYNTAHERLSSGIHHVRADRKRHTHGANRRCVVMALPPLCAARNDYGRCRLRNATRFRKSCHSKPTASDHRLRRRSCCLSGALAEIRCCNLYGGRIRVRAADGGRLRDKGSGLGLVTLPYSCDYELLSEFLADGSSYRVGRRNESTRAAKCRLRIFHHVRPDRRRRTRCQPDIDGKTILQRNGSSETRCPRF